MCWVLMMEKPSVQVPDEGFPNYIMVFLLLDTTEVSN